MRRVVACVAAAVVPLLVLAAPAAAHAQDGQDQAAASSKTRKPRPTRTTTPPPTTTTPPPTSTTPPPPNTTPPPAGEVVFNGDFETGDFSQYLTCQTKYYNGDCSTMPPNYPLTIVPGHQGQHAARFEVRDGDQPSWSLGERAQLVAYNTFETEGDEYWYDWSYMLGAGFPTTTDRWQTIMQWHPDGDGSSPFAFFVDNGKISLRTHPYLNGPWDGVRNVWQTPAVTGQWIDMRIHVKWSHDPNIAFVELWRNGVKQNFTDNPADNGNGTPCVGQQLCHFYNLAPGDAGMRAMPTYYRDYAITETGIVYHDNFVVSTP